MAPRLSTRSHPWSGGLIATYRTGMDQRAQQDIAATAAAHRELGPGFEDGLAEGLVERIGSEIDRRVDARLGQRGYSAPTPAAPGQPPATRSTMVPVAMALGSMLIAVLGTLGGAVITGLLQQKNAATSADAAESEQHRQERLTAYVEFGQALSQLRSAEFTRLSSRAELMHMAAWMQSAVLCLLACR